MVNRRDFLVSGALASAAIVASRARAQEGDHAGHGAHAGARGVAPEGTRVEQSDRSWVPARRTDRRPAFPGGQVPVHVPNGAKLRWRVQRGVKVGHVVVAPFEHEFAPGLRATCWGYNGRTPGPLVEAVEGDRVRIYVTNRLPEPTTIHWHGFILPNGMDGVSGLNQRPIPPGATYRYEFALSRAGTFMYHSHHDEMTQIALGCVGMFVVHPRRAVGPRVDRDFALMTHEWRVEPGTGRPDPNEMTDFNVFTFNGKAFPSTEPMLVGVGERTRIRLGNLSPMTTHPIHLHGHHFRVTQTDGGDVPASAQHPETTVLVPVGAVRVIETVSTEPGDWALHCHMTHHVMMQMGHDLPNMVGVDASRLDPRIRRVVPEYMSMGTRGMGDMGTMDMPLPENSIPMRGGPGPFSYIDMGGMMTVLKVREDPERADPAGWYAHPRDTVSSPATGDELREAGIDPDAMPEDDVAP
ncbi:multicopper oxidase family protein [Sandaracinus amylolyticus]|uniref:Multicopper oxidase n=1 Tax=Sandaracinus amylolyticus TaxID=927083 RepID=A0A0F6VZ88_9BACT|nr:copper oxidase [Sandaracinus amylolyticus]AKF03240.1 Multicopper oxidase [Sandaracinus amylolyticus]